MKKLRDACKALCAEHSQELFQEVGCFDNLFSFIDEKDFQNIALVTGRKSFVESPHYTKLQKEISPRVSSHFKVQPNPHVKDVEICLRELKSKPVDVIIAIGGGSSLDFAKVLSVFDVDTWDPLSKTIPDRTPIPLVAIATTAGTGSEATGYASLESTEGRKFSFDSPQFVPSTVFLDPELLMDQPVNVAACAGADSISQTMESLWSQKATDKSRQVASLALSVLIDAFEESILTPSLLNKERMQLGAFLGGAAIRISQTTAVHSVSYPLTARHHIPHGQALAILLPHFMKLNEPHLPESTKNQILTSLKQPNWKKAIHLINKIFLSTNLTKPLSSFGINNSHLDQLIEEGYRKDRMGNNPFIPEKETIHHLLKSIL